MSKSTTSLRRRSSLPTPDEYADFIGQIELLDVWLVREQVDNRHGPRAPHRAGVAITSPEPAWEDVRGGFDVRFPYNVRFADGDTLHAELTVTFGLRFSSSQPMTDRIFNVFKDVNLPVNTWPFLREYVSTTLGRMGWQPFTLPALKQGVSDEEDDVEPPPPRRATARARRARASTD